MTDQIKINNFKRLIEVEQTYIKQLEKELSDSEFDYCINHSISFETLRKKSVYTLIEKRKSNLLIEKYQQKIKELESKAS
jgi:hypothetical protein